MNLLEILSTRVPVAWTDSGHEHRGTFKLGEHTYVIELDEYVIPSGKHLLDFGFTTDGKIKATDAKQSSASIIGAVLNGALPEVKKIDPDVILVSVQKSSGLVESRKSLYSTVIRWLGRHLSGFTYVPEWAENKQGFYKLIAKEQLSDEELELFIASVKSKDR